MNQFDLVRATGKQPLYETIPFAEFHPNYTGELKVRVNPSRRMAQELQAAQGTEDNETIVRLTAELIPLDPDNPAVTIPYEDFKAWLESQDDDAAFSAWLMRTIWERVSAHFLAASASKSN